MAKNSRHMLAEAIDIRVPGVNTRVLNDTTLRMQRGGVGSLPGSKLYPRGRWARAKVVIFLDEYGAPFSIDKSSAASWL